MRRSLFLPVSIRLHDVELNLRGDASGGTPDVRNQKIMGRGSIVGRRALLIFTMSKAAKQRVYLSHYPSTEL